MSDRIDVSATVKVNDQSSGEIGRIRGALQGLQSMAQRVRQSFTQMGTMKGLGAAAKGVGSALQRLGSTVMSVVKPIAALVGITGGLSMAEAVAGMEKYVDTAKLLGRMAPILGTTVEGLSGLQNAASRVGIDTEKLNSALQGMQRQMGQASIGKLPALTSLMQKYGIQAIDPVTKKARDSTEILGDFAAVIARQKDPMMASRMAAAVFGRALGPEMLPLLNKGKEGIAAYIEEARRMGLIISDEQVKEAQDFAAAQGEVNRIWASLSRQLSQNLLPIIKPLIVLFGQLLAKYKTDIINAFTRAFSALGRALLAVKWDEVIRSTEAWVRWIRNDVVPALGGWKNVLIGLAVIMMGPTLAALLAVGGAVTKLVISLVSLAIANPIIALIVLAIAALAYAAYRIWKNWGPIKAFFIGLWDAVMAKFAEVRDWLSGWLPGFSDERIKAAWDGLATWFGNLFGEVKAAFDRVVEWLGPWGNLFLPIALYKNWEPISQFFSQLWAGDVQGAFDTAKAWLQSWLPQFAWDGLKAAWDAIKPYFETLLKGVSRAFEIAWGIIEPIIDAMRKAIEWITGNLPSLSGLGEKISGAGAAVFNAPGRAVDWAGDQFRNIFGGAAGAGPSIPQQATAQPSIVQQGAGVQQPARVEGQVGVDIHMTGAPPGTTIATHERGQVRATGDVGQTMAAPA